MISWVLVSSLVQEVSQVLSLDRQRRGGGETCDVSRGVGEKGSTGSRITSEGRSVSGVSDVFYGKGREMKQRVGGRGLRGRGSTKGSEGERKGEEDGRGGGGGRGGVQSGGNVSMEGYSSG